jgi:hypothetical protein
MNYYGTLSTIVDDAFLYSWIKLLKKLKITKLFSYETQLLLHTMPRPHYAYCIFNAAVLAKKLNEPKISIVEFGVAGGNGLKNIEFHAAHIEKLVGVEIEVYGFDNAEGLPKPSDYRDLPYLWQEGFYAMDQEKLKSQLTRSKLVLGNVSDTLSSWLEKGEHAKVGAVMFDLDYYSSTMAAFDIFRTRPEMCLPRVFCYMDDIIGDALAMCNDFTGVLKAIDEFNEESEDYKIAKVQHLTGPNEFGWYRQIYGCHLFNHPRYTDFISQDNQQLPLKKRL